MALEPKFGDSGVGARSSTTRACRVLSTAALRLWFLPSVGADQGQAALRTLLAWQLHCAPDELAFMQHRCPRCGERHGRHALRRHGATVHFSLALSGGFALVAIAPVIVGVSLEPIPGEETADAAARLLHPSEQVEISEAPEGERGMAFARAWARKEAYLKAVGAGAVHGLGGRIASEWTIADLPVAPGYAAAAALRGLVTG